MSDIILQEFMDAFFSRHLKNGDCWEWQGTIAYVKRSPRGYGKVWNPITKKQEWVHRLSWRLANKKEIPTNYIVRHACDNSICYNPDHLLIGTPLDNYLDMIKRGRRNVSIRPTCSHGHPYVGDNIYIVRYKNGKMQKKCHECRKESAKRYYHKHKKHMV